MPDPFAVAVKSIAVAHRNTKALLELSAKKVAQGIRANIDAGRNAEGFVAKGAPAIGGPMTPLSKATLQFRAEDGNTSTRPFYETGYTYDHIGGWLGDDISIRVGGTTKKARNCIELNYGTDYAESISSLDAVREALGSRVPLIKKDGSITHIPSRNPIGYSQKTADSIFSFWHKAMKVGDKTTSTSTMKITI